MEAKSIEWAVSQGIGAVLALVMFLIYRKDVTQALNSWQNQTKILTDLVGSIAAVLQANTDAIRAMERALPHACPMAERIAEGTLGVIAEHIVKKG